MRRDTISLDQKQTLLYVQEVVVPDQVLRSNFSCSIIIDKSYYTVLKYQ